MKTPYETIKQSEEELTRFVPASQESINIFNGDGRRHCSICGAQPELLRETYKSQTQALITALIEELEVRRVRNGQKVEWEQDPLSEDGADGYNQALADQQDSLRELRDKL